MWQKDAMLDESTRRLVASANSDIDGTGKIWPHNLHISTACVPHLEKVFSNVRQRYRLSLGDKNERPRCECGFLENFYFVRCSSSCSSSWERLFREFTFQQESVHAIIETVVHVTGKLITDQKEITSIPVVDWQQQMWQRTTVLTDKAVQFATAKTYVFSDSVL